jgi:hypothetical protein
MKCDTSVGTAKRKRTKACRVTKGSYQEFTDLVQGPRGQWLMAKALHLAIQHIDSLPPDKRSVSDQLDMQLILSQGYPTFAQLFQILDSEAEAGLI